MFLPWKLIVVARRREKHFIPDQLMVIRQSFYYLHLLCCCYGFLHYNYNNDIVSKKLNKGKIIVCLQGGLVLPGQLDMVLGKVLQQ